MDTGPSAPSCIVIGTAGHVDHGKTSLVRMLTGVETDRLPEEKARGISIELGFAPLTLPDGRRAAVVDVPGHERFLRTMVAGVTGIDLVLLVVAADEGVMPQTREHLQICALLGVRRGLVALTKMDLVDPELRALATEEVRGALRGTFLEAASVVACSNVTGEGRDDLMRALASATSQLPLRRADGPARLPIDRVFTIKGAGTVVTGTMASGQLHEGEPVVVVPGGGSARVRAIEVHGQRRTVARAGERTALNLAGVDREALAPGATVAGEGRVLATTCVDVELTWLAVCPAPLERRARVLFHALTTQESGAVYLLGAERLEPGATGFARIYLERGVALLPGDRFVLRGFRALPGHGTTVGGGRVIRLLPSRRPRRDPAAHQTAVRMAAAATEGERLLLELDTVGAAGLPPAELAARTGSGAEAMERALAGLRREGRVVLLGREPGRLVAVSELQRMEGVVLERLQTISAKLAPGTGTGVSREALRTSTPALARLGADLFTAMLERLSGAGRIELAAELVRLRGAAATALDPRQADLVDRLAALLTRSGLAPPALDEMAQQLGGDAPGTAQALKVLIGRGDAVRVGRELCFGRRAIDDLRDKLRAYLVAHGSISAQEMKALVGSSRKYVIPLAEHFDAEKLTLRVGDARRLRTFPRPPS